MALMAALLTALLVSAAVPQIRRAAAAEAAAAPASGYWLVATDGGLFSFGDAAFYGSTGAVKLNKPIVGMAPTASGKGYWLVASDGGLFSFGDAAFYGSGASSGRSFVAMTPTASGRGYWQAAATGEVLAFGDAADLGSARVNVPVVGMARTASGNGFWLVAGDGGIFSFGDARFLGSTGGVRLNQPIVGLGVPTPAGSQSAPVTNPGPSTPDPTPAPADPDPADPPPTNYQMEQISPPMESPNGGTHTDQIPTSGTDCGLPSAPQRTVLPADAENLGEASGLAASTRYPGFYWMIRDSAKGNRNAVYAMRFDPSGEVTSREIVVPGSTNGDWEEVNYTVGPDGKGRLWIVESGQPTSSGTFTDIYEVEEPDPATATEARLLNKYHYAFPDGSHNTEASFIHQGYLVLVAKMTPHAKLYRFESLTAGVTNVPKYIGELGNSKDVSVVRQSPDGKLLITSSHQVVHLYRSTDGSGMLRSFLGRLPDCELKAFPDENVESGEFSSNREMVFLDELRKTYRLKLAP
jgi:hypothetical protein